MQLGRGSRDRIPSMSQNFPMPPASGLFVHLKAQANLDYSALSHAGSIEITSRWVAVSSLAGARDKCEAFRDEHSLGGGNWAGGHVASDGKVVARVSYNGRIWANDGRELEGTEDPRRL